jgi:ABC-2 type transport system permease protein
MRRRNALMVFKRVLWSLRHDPRSIGMMLVAPILAMVIFGIAFSGEVENVKVVVIDLDEGIVIGGNVTVSLSREVIRNLDDEKLDISYSNDPDEAVEMVKEGKRNSVLIFPKDFTRSLLGAIEGGNVTSVVLRSDRSQVNIAAEVQSTVTEALLRTAKERGMDLPVSVDASDPVYGKGARFIDMFVPGIMGFVVFLLTTILTLISFVGERTRGTLQRLFASGVTEGEVVLGYMMAFSLVGVIQVGILLSVATLLFDIMIVGNPLVAFLIASLIAIVSVSLGILLSSLAQRESQAIQFFPLIILPVFLLSGVFWPREAMPLWLRPFSYLIPVTYGVDSLRSVLIRGWGVLEIWPQLLALIGFAVIFLFGAVAMLKVMRGR